MQQDVSKWRLIWPEHGPLLPVAGGVIGLLSDVGGFLGGVAAPWIWIPVALGSLLTVLLYLPCRNTVATQLAGHQGDVAEKQDDAYDCRICNVFRICLFAGVVCVVLALVGQGASATENIGTRLGLIEKKVDSIKSDTTVIRADTRAVRDVLSTMELVEHPANAQEYFHNAWVLNIQRGDSAGAWKAMQALYQSYAPNKLDAAELYFSVGKYYMGRDALLAQMIKIGREKRDASMLVIAARNTGTLEAAFGIYDEARAIDPDMPFAYWDVANTQVLFWGSQQSSTPNGNTPFIRQEIGKLEQFLAVAARKPVARYFYKPQFQGDNEQLARQMLESRRQLLGVQEQAQHAQDAAIARMRARISSIKGESR